MQKKMRNLKKGQNTLEYIVMVTGVLVALIFVFINPRGPFYQHYLQTLRFGTDGLLNLGCRLTTGAPMVKDYQDLSGQ